jgi:arsenical pump membrane protein
VSALDWAIAAAAIAGVVLRPRRIAEAWWAGAGAVALVITGAIAPAAALAAVERGRDVYLFLAGMMALAAYAGGAGVFDWIASFAVRIAGRSRVRLFALVYVAGAATTALFSNDATIVVLTPAVIDALRRYDASPVPYVVACALVANAASFLLPISNPSNLLVFAGRMPSLAQWLRPFALPSLAAMVVTFALAWWCFRRELAGRAAPVAVPPAARPEPVAVALLLASGAVVVTTSALGGPLGPATFACAVVAWIVAAVRGGGAAVAWHISWSIIALTAALFVIVTAVDNGGGFAASRAALEWCAQLPGAWSTVATGFAVGIASNVANNLPVGLNLGATLPAMHATSLTAQAALIGVNLGPNATANGSLATLLWLTILRRANIDVSPLAFARTGLLATIPALAVALVLL